MESKNKKSSEELQYQLKRIEEDKEEFRRLLKKFRDEEEEQEWKLQRQYYNLQELQQITSSDDKRSQRILCEMQDLINTTRLLRMEIADEIKETERKKKIEWEMREEEIHQQMPDLKKP